MATNSKNHIDLKILKYLQQDATPEEREFMENWIDSSDSNKKYFEEIKSVWKDSALLSDFDNIDIDKQWQIFKATTRKPKKTKSLLSPFLKIAASVVVLIGIAYFVHSTFFDKVSLRAEVGKKNKFVLPDASTIWLREGSMITYAKDFNENNRTVMLVGEGFFDIKGNAKKPFIIETANTRTEVIGTSFNLGTDPKTNNTTLVLIEGKVIFSLGEKKEILMAGDKIIAAQDGSLTKEKNTDPNFNAWKSKTLQFENTLLSDVLTALENYYGYSFIIQNQELYTCALTTRFKDQSLEQVLTTLKILLGIDYKILEDELSVTISNGGC